MDVFKQVTWWACVLLFLLHQFLEKLLHWHWVWVDSYLDDLLCMPILLGFLLFERRFLLQQPSYCLPFLDTTIIVILLSLMYEEVFPSAFNGFTRDYWDYFCYFISGLYFYVFVNTNNAANNVKEQQTNKMNIS